MSGLASNRSHIWRACSRASAVDWSPISSTMYLPILTSATLLKPRLFSECSTARPCGSRIPLRGVTKTFTRKRAPSSPRRAGNARRSGALSQASGLICSVPQPSGLHPAQHLVVSLLHPTQVAAKAIFVQLLARLLVPKAAGVGTDLIAQQDLALVATKLQLEIDQQDATLIEEPLEDFVDLKREGLDLLDLGGSRPSEFDRVFGVNQRIIERVGLVIVLDHRLLEGVALFAAEPLRHGTRDDISHHGFDRNDIEAFAQHLAVVQAAHKMGPDPGAFQQRE